MIILDDWTHPQGLPLLYLTTYSAHLVGAILIPGRYGLKDPAKSYPEYSHWPEYEDGTPADFLKLLDDPKYPKDKYGFHEQLWCGVFSNLQASPTFVCGQLEADTIKPVVEAMTTTCTKLYASPFDLYDLFEEIAVTQYWGPRHQWRQPNKDALEQVLRYLLANYFRDLQFQALSLQG